MASHKPKTRRQDVLHKDSLETVKLSLASLYTAVLHPYVLNKFKKLAKPILIVAGSIWFVGIALTFPVEVVAHLLELLSFGAISHASLSGIARSWVNSTVSLVPVLAILLTRTLLRKPLHKAFITLLREVNSDLAAFIEVNQTGQGEKEKRKPARLQKFVTLMAVELLLQAARRSPFLGRPAVVLTHFLTMKTALGRDRAIVLSLFGMVPYIEPWLLRGVQLWRSSNLLGQELISEYTTACIPASQRVQFCKEHDADITLFALPASLLLQVPLIGPLFFIPAQASAAFLVDKLERNSPSHQAAS